MYAAGNRSIGRRQFFGVLGAGAAVAAAPPVVVDAKADSESNDDKRKSRYRESDHVKAYYGVNRYPG